MGTKEEASSEQLINRNLTSLIAVIFLFYGGLSCLYSTLIPHMTEVGIKNPHDICKILITVALISLFGPVLIGPIIDRIADRNKAAYGRKLQYILAILLVLGAIAYAFLLRVPRTKPSKELNPLVTFGCDADGAVIFQQRCHDSNQCYRWKNGKAGDLMLLNCSYTCQDPLNFKNLYNPWNTVQLVSESEDDDYTDETGKPRQRRQAAADLRGSGINTQQVYVEPPHLCSYVIENGTRRTTECHVYTADSKVLTIPAEIPGTPESELNTEQNSTKIEWCKYPLNSFTCNIPEQQAAFMRNYTKNRECKPMIECKVHDPYGNPSVLAESVCYETDSRPHETFWSYVLIRSLADIFPVAIITALNTAILIATRETSSGRADVGRQLAWGAAGWAVFPLILGVAGVHTDITIPVIVCAVLWIVAAIILILAKHMPLSPPEWWWHTKIGMLAIPLSAIRKYGPEIAALIAVAIILGAFWSIIDTYQPLHLIASPHPDVPKVIKFALTAAAIPAIIILWNAESIVDYCGHANILIAAFAFYILRYTGLALMTNPWFALVTHALESITLVLVFATLILYMRHLIPRRLLATGQALPVIAILCIGKAIGAIIILFYDKGEILFRELAITSAIVGTAYFLLYHGYLARECAAARQPPPSPAELQTHANGAGQNGTAPPPAPGNNYTPLRIYHNARGRKGHFRY